MPEGAFIIEPLNPARHRREEFDCGVPALNDFLRTRARKEAEAGTSNSFVLVLDSDPAQIAGYYTLSSATIVRTALPEAMTRKLPRYTELPATLLGRLARDLRFKGRKTGSHLMWSALNRAVEAAKEVASWAIITDPKDERVRQFYEGFGFQSLDAGRMFLPMKQAADLISAR